MICTCNGNHEMDMLYDPNLHPRKAHHLIGSEHDFSVLAHGSILRKIIAGPSRGSTYESFLFTSTMGKKREAEVSHDDFKIHKKPKNAANIHGQFRKNELDADAVGLFPLASLCIHC